MAVSFDDVSELTVSSRLIMRDYEKVLQIL